MNKIRTTFFLAVLAVPMVFSAYSFGNKKKDVLLSEAAALRSFSVEVSCIGELEAKSAITISSQLKGDRAKLISLIQDGQFVEEGETLAKIDPAPFEEILRELEIKYQETVLAIENNRAFLEREESQVEHENEIAAFEVETAKLEIIKIKEGEAPLEISKLEHTINKSQRKCNEISCFLKELEDQNLAKVLGPIEIGKVKKQYSEENETLNSAKEQYDAYVHHGLPSQIKKAEMNLEKAMLKKSEAKKNGGYRLLKAKMNEKSCEFSLLALKQKIEEAKKELSETLIKAPSPGIVVLKEEFRNGQRRKPRVGDILLRNQPLLDLPDLTSMIVKTKVREIDLHKIAVGKKALVEVHAFPSRFFEGTVFSIGVLAQADPYHPASEKYFEVIIRLNETSENLRPGMTASVNIHSETFKEVLTVPSFAIFRVGSNFYCYRQAVKGIEKSRISIKEGNNAYAIVEDGLQEGDEVLLSPPETFLEGI